MSIAAEPTRIDVADLALARPGSDAAQDRYAARLDAAVPRVLARLHGKIDPAVHAAAAGVLARWQALPATERREVLLHPLFAYWWVKLKERYATGRAAAVEEWLRHFGRFVVVPSIRHGLADGGPVELTVDDAGDVRFPGHRRQVRLGRAAAGTSATATWCPGGVVTVTAAGSTVDVDAASLVGPAPPVGGPVVERPAIPGTSIEVDAGDAWLAALFESLNARPAPEGYPARDLRLLDPLPPSVVPHLGDAHAVLAAAWPEMAVEIADHTRLVVPFASGAYSTFTEPAFMGAVFLGEARHPFASTLFTAEHLLHEHSHLRLTLLMEVDPILSTDPGVMVASPWRRDARPLHQVVHGSFVFARIIRFLERAEEATGDAAYGARRAEVVADLGRAVPVLEDAGPYLTAVGRDLVEQIRSAAVGAP